VFAWEHIAASTSLLELSSLEVQDLVSFEANDIEASEEVFFTVSSMDFGYLIDGRPCDLRCRLGGFGSLHVTSRIPV
jgi:hypothetical protein